MVNYGMPVLSKSNIVEITFEKADKIAVYQNGRKELINFTDNKTTLFLEAGQGVFIEVENYWSNNESCKKYLEVKRWKRKGYMNV